jgi:D-alanyl-lipoteichoic acid acyltransferase DltB (MBOAT superfamily)
VNFNLGKKLSAEVEDTPGKRHWLIAGIVFNLGLLAYFKYANFFLGEVSPLLGITSIRLDVLLPIGISFYTFQQIAFLVDSYKESTRYNLLNYCLFVSFFPQLIAGPIVHHKEMMPQFDKPIDAKALMGDASLGVFYFVSGLFKKVIIADNLSVFASPIFAVADGGGSVTFFEAWLGTLAYSLQLYFDFSGYSDMAIGLALLFGIKLPVNFNSPYKSRSIVEFWRRWHITLSTFLRDYLYIALGGNRRGKIMRYRNLLLTMAIGGLWHGAGWGFIIWGTLHGLFLCINHFSGFLRDRYKAWSGIITPLAWPLTLLAAILAWVPFRATTLDGTLTMWSAMFGGSDFGLPNTLLGMLNIELDQNAFWAPLFNGQDIIELQDWAYRGVPLIIGGGLIALFLPNTQQMAAWFEKTLHNGYTRLAALFFSLLFLIAVSQLNKATEFMYFQF